MFRRIIITYVLMFFICVLSSCDEEPQKLSKLEIAWEANKRLRSMKDSIRKKVILDCNVNFSEYVNSKVDSLIIEYLKNTDTSSISRQTDDLK